MVPSSRRHMPVRDLASATLTATPIPASTAGAVVWRRQQGFVMLRDLSTVMGLRHHEER
jgi:hypothetical protein